MRLRFHKRSLDRSAKCNIVAGDGIIHVAVYDLERRERARLDRIEGVGNGYSLATIQARDYGDCFTYVASPSHIDDMLRPYSWYKELVLAGCAALGFPDDYISMIRNVATIRDPDETRHMENMQIVDRARRSGVPQSDAEHLSREPMK
jgi:hypothetical protein